MKPKIFLAVAGLGTLALVLMLVLLFRPSANTKLMRAIYNNDINAIRQSIEDKVDINARVNKMPHDYALVAAVEKCNMEIVALLLSRGATPSIDDDAPLVLAIEKGCTDIINALLNTGAVPGGNANFKPLKHAIAKGNLETIRALLKIHTAKGTDKNVIATEFLDADKPSSINVTAIATEYGFLDSLLKIKEERRQARQKEYKKQLSQKIEGRAKSKFNEFEKARLSALNEIQTKNIAAQKYIDAVDLGNAIHEFIYDSAEKEFTEAQIDKYTREHFLNKEVVIKAIVNDVQTQESQIITKKGAYISAQLPPPSNRKKQGGVFQALGDLFKAATGLQPNVNLYYRGDRSDDIFKLSKGNAYLFHCKFDHYQKDSMLFTHVLSNCYVIGQDELAELTAQTPIPEHLRQETNIAVASKIAEMEILDQEVQNKYAFVGSERSPERLYNYFYDIYELYPDSISAAYHAIYWGLQMEIPPVDTIKKMGEFYIGIHKALSNPNSPMAEQEYVLGKIHLIKDNYKASAIHFANALLANPDGPLSALINKGIEECASKDKYCLQRINDLKTKKPATLPAIGKYPADVFKENENVVLQLKNILGNDWKLFERNMSVSSAMKRDGDYLYGEGLAPHQGGSEEAIFTINASTGDVSNAAILSGEFNNTIKYYGQAPLPQIIANWHK